MVERAERQQGELGTAVAQRLRSAGHGPVAARDDHASRARRAGDGLRHGIAAKQPDVGAMPAGCEGAFEDADEAVTCRHRLATGGVDQNGERFSRGHDGETGERRNGSRSGPGMACRKTGNPPLFMLCSTVSADERRDEREGRVRC